MIPCSPHVTLVTPKSSVQESADRLAYIEVHADVSHVVIMVGKHFGQVALLHVGVAQAGIGNSESDESACIGALQSYRAFMGKA